MKKLFVLLMGLLYISFIVYSPPLELHECEWKNCELQGFLFFRNIDECEDWVDCKIVLQTHFEHPDWTYYQCETYAFNIVKY